MTRKVYKRVVEIVTMTITCEGCGFRSGAMGEDTLLYRGWTLKTGNEKCPECAELAVQQEHLAAQARYIAALESGEPILVHGRVYTKNGVEFR